jgi:lipoprotein-releasing system permease protein
VAFIAIISFLSTMASVFALIVTLSIMSGLPAELLNRMLLQRPYVRLGSGAERAGPRGGAHPDQGRARRGQRSIPLVETQALIQGGGQTTGAIVRGLRPPTWTRCSMSTRACRPRPARPSVRAPTAATGSHRPDPAGPAGPARRRSHHPVFSPSGADSAFGNLGGLSKTYFVGGAYSSGTADYDRAFIFMPLEQAQLFFGKEGVWDVIELKVANPDQVQTYSDPCAKRRAAALWSPTGPCVWPPSGAR